VEEELAAEVEVLPERGEVEAQRGETRQERGGAGSVQRAVEREDEGVLARREEEDSLRARPREPEAPRSRLVVARALRHEVVGRPGVRFRLARGERERELGERRLEREDGLEVARREEREAERARLHAHQPVPVEGGVLRQLVPLRDELRADARPR